MYGIGIAEGYAEAAANPAPERAPIDSLVELREQLGVLAHQDLETMLVGKHSPMELDIACVETENRQNKLIADKEGVNVRRTKTLYERELELNRLDTSHELQSLRDDHVDAKDDQEQAEERLATLQPDLDLITGIRAKQKELTAGYRRKSKLVGGAVALLVSLAVAYGAKDDNEAEALAVIPVMTAVGVGLGECAARGTYRSRAHCVAKLDYEHAKATTVILKPYVR